MTPEKTIRTFFGLGVDAATTQVIADYQQALKQKLKQSTVRWVEPSNFHITVHYLGNTTAKQITRLTNSMTTAVRQLECFTTGLHSAIAFPNENHPRVLALTADVNDSLLKLNTMVGACAVAENFAAENRVYRPHLSIGRVKKAIDEDIIQSVALPPLVLTVNELIYYQSLSTKNGVEYRPLHRFNLLESLDP